MEPEERKAISEIINMIDANLKVLRKMIRVIDSDWKPMKKDGIYCPKCDRLIVILPKQNRDFDEVKCSYDGCDGIWVNEELELVQSPQNHATQELGSGDEGKKGQARADKEGDELPES